MKIAQDFAILYSTTGYDHTMVQAAARSKERYRRKHIDSSHVMGTDPATSRKRADFWWLQLVIMLFAKFLIFLKGCRCFVHRIGLE